MISGFDLHGGKVGGPKLSGTISESVALFREDFVEGLGLFMG